MASFLKDTIGIGAAIQSSEIITPPKKGRLKSPSGRVSKFDFEDVESKISVKNTVFETASGSGTYVQGKGNTGGRFPMNCFFHGAGHRENADAFTASLLESGVCLLTHPSYSRDIYVKPVGEISRTDNFVTGAGQTIISVEFFETTGLKVGTAKGLPQLYDSFAESAAMDFERSTKLSDPVDRASLKNHVTRISKTVSSAMKKASGAVAKVNHAIEDTGDSINRNIDIMIGQPLALARQCQMLVSEPRRQNDLVNAKLDAYNGLAADIFSRSIVEPRAYMNDSVNQFHLNRLFAKSIVANSCMLCSETAEFTKRIEYLEAAEKLKGLMVDLQTWNDTNYAAINTAYLDDEGVDTGDGLSELQDLFSSVLSILLQKSFSALTEMKKPLESDRTPIDLCFELYGTSNLDVLDAFCETNELAGKEMFLIPKGREIVWYV